MGQMDDTVYWPVAIDASTSSMNELVNGPHAVAQIADMAEAQALSLFIRRLLISLAEKGIVRQEQ